MTDPRLVVVECQERWRAIRGCDAWGAMDTHHWCCKSPADHKGPHECACGMRKARRS